MYSIVKHLDGFMGNYSRFPYWGNTGKFIS